MVTARQMESALRSVGGYGGQGWSMSTLAAGATTALQQTGITTAKGAAVFLAQCMVESAYFRTTREYGGPNTRYAPYYGRGFIQVTWETNYRSFGAWAAQRDLVPSAGYFLAPHEDRLADSKWAWLGAVWYFSTHRHDLVALADKGDNVRVGRAINRGSAYSSYASYGEAERDKAYRAFLNAGVTAPGPAAFRYDPPVKGYTTADVQKIVGVTVDNLYGDDTKAAVRRLQRKLGVKADGYFGPTTASAYEASQKKGGEGKGGKKAPDFPLPKGHWYGVESSNPRNHSGYWKKDREGIRRWQRRMKRRGWTISVDGIFGDQSDSVARAFQREKRLSVDGLVGRRTWRAAWEEPVT